MNKKEFTKLEVLGLMFGSLLCGIGIGFGIMMLTASYFGWTMNIKEIEEKAKELEKRSIEVRTILRFAFNLVEMDQIKEYKSSWEGDSHIINVKITKKISRGW